MELVNGGWYPIFNPESPSIVRVQKLYVNKCKKCGKTWFKFKNPYNSFSDAKIPVSALDAVLLVLNGKVYVLKGAVKVVEVPKYAEITMNPKKAILIMDDPTSKIVIADKITKAKIDTEGVNESLCVNCIEKWLREHEPAYRQGNLLIYNDENGEISDHISTIYNYDGKECKEINVSNRLFNHEFKNFRVITRRIRTGIIAKPCEMYDKEFIITSADHPELRIQYIPTALFY
ncbi:MAG TPA: hypothetical protein ENG16_05320, partial [Archaeoglobus sp.]|nr:hypothetical protein [Archaeoglobus sp.]